MNPKASAQSSASSLSLFLALGVCILPVLAVFAPRFLAFAPGIIGVLGLVSVFSERKRWPIVDIAALVIPGVIIALMAISSLWAVDQQVALERVGKAGLVLLGAVLFFYFARNAREDVVDAVQRVFPWAVLCAGFLLVLDLYLDGIFYNLLHADDIYNDGSKNLSALNRSVVIFLFSGIIALWCFFYGRSLSGTPKAISIISLSILMVLVLFKTHSQSAQMAAVLSFIIFVIFSRVPQVMLCRAVGVLVAILVVFTPWIAQGLFAYLTPYIIDVSWFSDGYAADRMEIWDFVVRRALEQPIIGHGVEATRVITDFDTQKLFHPATEVLHPHNFAAQLWIEFGALGAVMFIGISSFFVKVISGLEPPAACLALILYIACISVAATGYGIWQSWWLGTFSFVIVGVVFVQKMLQQNKTGQGIS